MSYTDGVINHYVANWGQSFERLTTSEGRHRDLPEDFCVVEFPPHGQRNLWTYATCGMSAEMPDRALELHLFSQRQERGLTTLLYALAHYHRTGTALGLHHSVQFGIPWLDKSRCTCGYITLPYLDGPLLENGIIDSAAVSFLWLIPITPEELALKKTSGVERLEDLLEAAGFDYANPHRPSVA